MYPGRWPGTRGAIYWILTLLLIAVCFSQPAIAEIPAGPEVPTSRAKSEIEASLWNRLMLEPYRARLTEAGKQADDDPGYQFVRLWIENFSMGNEAPRIEPLIAQGKKATEAGCNDPLFNYCYGRVLAHQQELGEAARLLNDALERLEGEGYDVGIGAAAARNLAIVLRELNRRDEAAALLDREIEYLTRTLADGPYLPDEQRSLYEKFKVSADGYPIERLQPIVDKINVHLYPWLFHMASAETDVKLAWKARGGGWASQVTEEGWKGFEKHMVAAREHLNEAWNLNPEWPEPAAKMISVVMAGHGQPEDTARLWFDRAVTAEFDHLPAYNALLWSLMPRWGGSHQELYALGRECLDTGRFDTRVPYVYVQAFDHIVSDIGSTYDYYKTPGVFEDLQTLADGYLAEPSMAEHHPWYRSFKVAAAVRCERWQEAGKFLETLGGEPNEGAFTRFGLRSDEVLGEVYARSGEFAEDTAAAEELAASGKFDEAKAKYESLASKAGDRQVVTTYFRGRLQGVEFDDAFSKGEWTALPLDAQLSGWRSQGGNWSVDKQGRLVAKPQKDGLRLVYDKKLGARFELRGNVTLVKRPYSKSNIGIYFGQAEGAMPYSLMMFFDEDFAALMNQKEMIARNPVTVDKSVSFRVERWDNTINAYVNDKRVADAVEIQPAGLLENEVFALGGNYWYDGPILRFDGLEIRKLDNPPQGISEKVDAAEADVAEAEETDSPDESDASDATESE